MRDAASIRFTTDQTRGVGTTTVVDTKVGPLHVSDHMTITEWVEGEAMGVEHTGVVTGRGRFTLRPNGRGGTRFAWDEDLHFPWWLGGPAGEAVGGRVVLARVWRRNLQALKRLVEEGQGRWRWWGLAGDQGRPGAAGQLRAHLDRQLHEAVGGRRQGPPGAAHDA